MVSQCPIRCEKADDHLHAAAHTELPIEALKVRVHCMTGDAELLGDGRFMVVADNTARDLSLSSRKAERVNDRAPLGLRGKQRSRA